VGLAACGAGAPSSGELADALVTSGLERPLAECAADALTTTLTEDELALLAERGPSGLPADDPERTDDASDQLRDAMSACRTAQDAADGPGDAGGEGADGSVPVPETLPVDDGQVDDGPVLDTVPAEPGG
jgi:hypothetical protein